MIKFSNKILLDAYSDFDRLFEKDIFIVTVIGVLLTFLTSYFVQTFVPIPILPYGLAFPIAIALITSVYSKNFASSALVGLIGGIGLVSPNGDIIWILGYIGWLTSLTIIIGYLSNLLKRINKWNGFIIITHIIFIWYMIGLSMLTNQYADIYWNKGVPIATGKDIFFGTNYPLLDIFVGLGLTTVFILLTIPLWGDKMLDKKSANKYSIFGYLLLIIGQLLIAIGFFATKVSFSGKLALELNTLNDLFIHLKQPIYAVYTIVNIYYIIALYTTLTGLGIMYIMTGYAMGVLEGRRGNVYVNYFVLPLGIVLYLLYSSYYIQQYLVPGGYYLSMSLLPVYLATIFPALVIYQNISAIVGLILNKITNH